MPRERAAPNEAGQDAADGTLRHAVPSALNAQGPAVGAAAAGRNQSEFDRHDNLACLDDQLPPATVRLVLKHYLASLAVYGSVLLLLTLNPWFDLLLSVSFHEVTGHHVYRWLFVVYAVLAPLVLLAGRPRSLWSSKNLAIVGFLTRVVHTLWRSDRGQQWQRCRPDYHEKHAVMFLLIKIVFGPLMLYFVLYFLAQIPSLLFRLEFPSQWYDVWDVWYLVFFCSISVLDAAIFFVGYTTEAGFLGNRLRYAETNLFRILVCIICYEPFILATSSIIGPSRITEQIVFQNDLAHPMTWVLRGLAVLALLGLISSSLSLFTRASNLTNRGIVQWGPYALVRHPGYVAKNLFWLITLVPLFFADTTAADFSWSAHALLCGRTLLGWLAWGSIYYMRAITEEQFLSRDPDYVAYCQKVRYRFIPWLI